MIKIDLKNKTYVWEISISNVKSLAMIDSLFSWYPFIPAYLMEKLMKMIFPKR